MEVEQSKIKQVYIIKDKNKELEFANTRPITILPLMWKLIDAILYKRIKEELRIDENISEKYPSLANNQTGFRKKMNTHLNLNTIISEIDNLVKKIDNKDSKDDYWLLFIDFKGAYNSVNHNILWNKMKRVGVKQQTI